jgi:hypothetical protein
MKVAEISAASSGGPSHRRRIARSLFQPLETQVVATARLINKAMASAATAEPTVSASTGTV